MAVLLIFLSLIITFIIILFFVFKNIIGHNPKFSADPNDYRIDKVTLYDNTTLYEPWGKLKNGKWKQLFPSCETYEEAKNICDKKCHEHNYIISRETIL